MVGHLVLYEFKPGLPPGERQRFADTLRAALASIDEVRSIRLGRRIAIGAGYEPGDSDGFSWFALLEFADADGLRAYLEHPAHAELARLFWESSARTLVQDFEIADGAAPPRHWI